MNSVITLLKKNFMKIIIVLGLIWTVSNVFALGQLAAAGTFSAVVVPTVTVAMGKKYAIPMAV
ncbi:MAG: hypothetical protein BZY82_01660 [SAR202 cluster bacterium Io17-Chloro-G3]|nr:MAG: hypothetical protein BZY82_01660 [SAR202 cluster bacterium Io17-Chloro-G3]